MTPPARKRGHQVHAVVEEPVHVDSAAAILPLTTWRLSVGSSANAPTSSAIGTMDFSVRDPTMANASAIGVGANLGGQEKPASVRKAWRIAGTLRLEKSVQTKAYASATCVDAVPQRVGGILASGVRTVQPVEAAVLSTNLAFNARHLAQEI